MLQVGAPYFVIFVLNLFGGAIATLGVGLALTTLTLNLPLVFIAILLADTVSDTVYYCIGRFASHALRSRFIGKNRKMSARFTMVERYFHQHGASTVFLGKMSDILAIPAVVLAGATKMPFGRYLLICVPTSTLKTVIVLLAGYLLSRSTDTSDAHFVVYGIAGAFLLVCIIVVSRQFYVMVQKEAAANRRVSRRSKRAAR